MLHADMSAFAFTAYSLATILCWGAGDFIGGYAAKRANAFALTLCAHTGGLLLIGTLTYLSHAAVPSRSDALWAIAGGLSGGAALAIFYRALASGKMGVTAPVSAVLGAAIPVLFAIFTEGLPHAVQLGGFALAAAGIVLISRPEDGVARPEGLSLAVLAGFGFAGFFLCMKQTGDASALWSATFSRLASLVLVFFIVLATRPEQKPDAKSATLGALAGCLDVSGTALYVRASQTGRLDAAVVLTSLYPAVTVVLARILLREHFTAWKMAGIVAALLAVPMIAAQ
jgi:drug/metabolite transporter (DMT)-like permease